MTRFRATPRERTSRGTVRTTRVRRRQIEFVADWGHCERCRRSKGLEAFWRSREDRPLGTIQAFWLAADEVRAQLADKIIVLCPEHMRIHKGGSPHGGGAAGVKGCDCDPCADRLREYVKNKHRQRRAARREMSEVSGRLSGVGPLEERE